MRTDRDSAGKTGHRYSYWDWRLYNAIKSGKSERIGSAAVVARNGFLYVSYNNVVFFTYCKGGEYWRVDTWGNTRRWFVDKVNCCLHAINAPCRVFVNLERKLSVVDANGVACHNVKWFNNQITGRGF
jgi:hypothetical protein